MGNKNTTKKAIDEKKKAIDEKKKAIDEKNEKKNAIDNAMKTDDVDYIKSLCEVNNYSEKNPFLCWASLYECPSIMTFLIKNGADVNFQNGIPLYTSIKKGHYKNIMILLKSTRINTYPDINTKTPFNELLFHHKLFDKQQFIELVKEFLKQDIILHIKDGYKKNTLDYIKEYEICIEAKDLINERSRKIRAFNYEEFDTIKEELKNLRIELDALKESLILLTNHFLFLVCLIIFFQILY